MASRSALLGCADHPKLVSARVDQTHIPVPPWQPRHTYQFRPFQALHAQEPSQAAEHGLSRRLHPLFLDQIDAMTKAARRPDEDIEVRAQLAHGLEYQSLASMLAPPVRQFRGARHRPLAASISLPLLLNAPRHARVHTFGDPHHNIHNRGTAHAVGETDGDAVAASTAAMPTNLSLDGAPPLRIRLSPGVMPRSLGLQTSASCGKRLPSREHICQAINSTSIAHSVVSLLGELARERRARCLELLQKPPEERTVRIETVELLGLAWTY